MSVYQANAKTPENPTKPIDDTGSQVSSANGQLNQGTSAGSTVDQQGFSSPPLYSTNVPVQAIPLQAAPVESGTAQSDGSDTRSCFCADVCLVVLVAIVGSLVIVFSTFLIGFLFFFLMRLGLDGVDWLTGRQASVASQISQAIASQMPQASQTPLQLSAR